MSSDEQRRLVDLGRGPCRRRLRPRRRGGSRCVAATGSYADATLAALRAPGRDASGLADVLRNEEIGGFSVETVLDAPADVLRRQVARFCAQARTPSDLALVYLSSTG